jgi:TonB family protein
MTAPGILSAFVEALGWTLLHFLWQGLVIGLVYAGAMFTLKEASANARYWTGMMTLAAMLAAPLLTISVQFDAATSAFGVTPVAVVSGAVTAAATGPDLLSTIEQRVESLLPWAVLAWFVGVMLLSGRLALDFVRIRRLAMVDVAPLSPELQRAVDRLVESLQIRSAVRVLESARVAVPMVVGWLRPVILLPPSALMGLTPRQLELIISHELAHVKRLDYLFNLLQIIVETLLFYHPVVRMVSIRVRMERENCCDDIVVARTGDTLAYARALTEVEGLRCSSGMQLSLAATGGHLRGRVTRLVAAPAPQRGAVHWVAGLVLLASGFGAISGARVALKEPPAPEALVQEAPPAPAATSGTDATPVVEPIAPAPVMSAAADPVRPEPAPEPAPEPEFHAAETPVAPAPAASQEPAPTVPRSPPSPVEYDKPVITEPPEAPPVKLAMARPPAVTPAPQPSESPVPALPAAPANEPVAETAVKRAPVPEVPVAVEPVPDDRRQQGEQEPEEPVEPAAPPASEITGGALIKSPPPAYPRRARLNGQRGFVTARYRVATNGKVEDVSIVDSTSAQFERPVKRTLRRWRYEPFLVGGEPVAIKVERTFEFDLEGQAMTERERNVRCAKVTGSRLCRSRTGYDDLGVVVVYNEP